jgi:hypothetical protein
MTTKLIKRKCDICHKVFETVEFLNEWMCDECTGPTAQLFGLGRPIDTRKDVEELGYNGQGSWDNAVRVNEAKAKTWYKKAQSNLVQERTPYDEAADSDAINYYMAKITERFGEKNATVVKMYYGVGCKHVSINEIAKLFNVHRTRIHDIINHINNFVWHQRLLEEKQPTQYDWYKYHQAQASSVTLYHGTLRKNLKAIMTHGLTESSGWGGAGTSGVYLSSTKEGALYWAKMAYMREIEEEMELARFDRRYGKNANQLLAVLTVTIPPEALQNLQADMEQAEDVEYDGDPADWQASLDQIGDARFQGRVPPEWISLAN